MKGRYKPSSLDVQGTVDVRMAGEPAVQTDKGFLSLAVGLGAIPARRTSAAGVARIDDREGDAVAQRLVFDESAQLMKAPTGMLRALLPPNRWLGALADTRQFLDGYPATECLGLGDDAFAEDVVDSLINVFHAPQRHLQFQAILAVQAHIALRDKFSLPLFDNKIRGDFLAKNDNAPVTRNDPVPSALPVWTIGRMLGNVSGSDQKVIVEPLQKVWAGRCDGSVEAANTILCHAHVNAAFAIEYTSEIVSLVLRKMSECAYNRITKLPGFRLFLRPEPPGPKPDTSNRAIRQKDFLKFARGHVWIMLTDYHVLFNTVVGAAAHAIILTTNHVVSKRGGGAITGFAASDSPQDAFAGLRSSSLEVPAILP